MIEEVLGKGAYATVFMVRSAKNGKQYAAKILRNDPYAMSLCVKHELKLLIELNKLEKALKQGVEYIEGIRDLNTSKVVVLKDYFNITQEVPINVVHLVLIFEKLEMSLYNVLESTEYQGLSMFMIQQFTSYCMEGLLLLKARRITHSDIKPENIMLVE